MNKCFIYIYFFNILVCGTPRIPWKTFQTPIKIQEKDVFESSVKYIFLQISLKKTTVRYMVLYRSTHILCFSKLTSSFYFVFFRPDPNSSSFRRPTSDMNIASGCPMFMPLRRLESSIDRYVKDDTMFIQIHVQQGEQTVPTGLSPPPSTD